MNKFKLGDIIEPLNPNTSTDALFLVVSEEEAEANGCYTVIFLNHHRLCNIREGRMYHFNDDFDSEIMERGDNKEINLRDYNYILEKTETSYNIVRVKDDIKSVLYSTNSEREANEYLQSLKYLIS